MDIKEEINQKNFHRTARGQYLSLAIYELAETMCQDESFLSSVRKHLNTKGCKDIDLSTLLLQHRKSNS